MFIGRVFDRVFSSSRVWKQLLCIIGCGLIGIVILYVLGGFHLFDADGWIIKKLNAIGCDTARLMRIVQLMLDPGNFGNGDDDAGMSALWQLFITLVGTVVFLSMVINAFGNVVDNRIENYRKGFVRYWFNDHVVFLGANEVIIGMIDHLATIEKFRKKKFVVLTSDDCEKVRDNITSHLSEEAKKLKITFLFGERNNDDTLRSIYINRASHIYIVGEDKELERDSINIECWNIIKTIRLEVVDKFNKCSLRGICRSRRMTRLCKWFKESGLSKKLNIAKCYLILDRQSSTWVFNKMKADPNSGIETNVIDTLESLSQRVLVNPQSDNGRPVPPTLDGPEGIRRESEKTVHLVIFGMTQMASAMAMTAAHLCHFPNYLRDPSKKTTITFIAPDAKQEMAFLTGRYFHLFRHSEYEYLEEGMSDDERKKNSHVSEGEDFLDIRWRFVKGSIEQSWIRKLLMGYYENHKIGKERLTLAICGNDAESNIASALYLPEAFYAKKKESGCDDVTILVYQPVSGERIYTACAKTYRYSNVYPFGQYDRSYDPSYRARLLAAKKINYLYKVCKNYKKMPDTYTELDELWRDKTFLDRASSMYSANSIYMKLRSVGLTPESTKEELKPYVEMLSEVEHNRWDVERLILGVAEPTQEQREEYLALADPGVLKSYWKQNLHLNINLVPYKDLDEGTKGYDRTIVSNMLDVIKKC